MNTKIELHKGDLPENLDLGTIVAVDGEFLGLNVRRDRLCLIQVSSGNSDAHIVQLDRENYNAPNLVKILADKNIKKLFHYARSDLTHIKYYLKTDVNNIECSKIKSKLARTFSDSHSLKTLIKEFANVDVSKQFQTSDFGGELSQGQLKYCANDVIYLHKIHSELDKILEREKRMDLYRECIKFLHTRIKLDLLEFKDDIWSH
uniref:Ribonuclease d n=1 Tax=uncultured SAR11 cluster bacterium HF0010_09O16 TaxID=710725 RepID=E0XWZ2_9PROT|nr:ribonuclease d [uncultured SAR11 cluster bacterium HF0010_09O16]